MKRLQEKFKHLGAFKNVHREAGKRGFVGIMKPLKKTYLQVALNNGFICLLYLACPFVLEFCFNQEASLMIVGVASLDRKFVFIISSRRSG